MAFHIIRDDITRVKADAIVNTANPKPIYGGGTDHAIYRAAGRRELLQARRMIGDIARGQAVETPAFRLPAKYIIHTVGPVWEGGKHGEFEILRACYSHSLELALKLECSSIAFPLIATGVYGFPKDQALQIALAVIEPFVMKHPDFDVTLVVFDKRAFELSGTVVEHVREFVDANYVETAHQREYAFDRLRNRTPEYEKTQSRLKLRSEQQERWYSRSTRTLQDTEEDDLCDEMLMPDSADHGFSISSAGETGKAEVCSTKAIETDGYALEDEQLELENLKTGLGCVPTRRSPSAPFFPAASIPTQTTSVPAAICPPAPGSKVDIDALLAASEKTFQEKLFEIIDERGLTGPQVYKNYISKQVYSKLQADKNYHPNKFTAIALCLSLHLSYEETQDLIGRAGWTLSRSNKADLVVIGCIMNGEYNLVRINIILFDYDCPELEKIR